MADGNPPIVDDKDAPDIGEVKTDKEIETVSLKEYQALQAHLLETDAKISRIEAEKVAVEKASIMEKLTAINPKLAEINKDAGIPTLQAVLASAESMKSGFKKHYSDKEEPKKPDISNHESMDYNFVEKKWEFK